MARRAAGTSTLRQNGEAGTVVAPVTLRGKLLPPEVPAAYVARPDLDRRLDEAVERPLTTVVAGPGFGKSTALAAWAARVGAAWYTADSSDRSLATFVRGLEAALRMRLPMLSGSAARAVSGSTGLGRDESEQAEPLAALLLHELENELDGDLVLVIDDVHELPRGAAAARLLAAVARQAPPALHLVLCGRTEPPFRLERLRGRGQVSSIDSELLAFRLRDVDDLLARVGLAASGLAERVHRLTGGWPAAVRLTAEGLRTVPADRLDETLARLPRRGGRLFSYLAEEVFERAQPSVRSLLRHAAALEGFSPALCEWLGVEGAHRTIERLAERGLFLQSAAQSGDWYTVHALVREFALERWPVSGDELRDINRRAAEWLESAGRVDEGLRALTRSRDGEGLARFLAIHGEALLATGFAGEVLRAAEFLPDQREPQLDEIVGDAQALRGAWDEALSCYLRAARGADRLPARLAFRLGMIHAPRAEVDEALAQFRRGLDDRSDPVATALLLSWIATCRWGLGETELARESAPEALEAARRAGDDRALAAAHNLLMLTNLGRDPAAAEQHGRLGLAAARSAGDALQEIRIRLNLFGVLQPNEALPEAEEALRLAELVGAELYTGAALLTRGMTLRNLGRLDRAAADFERAASLYERHGSNRVARAYANLAFVYENRGALASARRLFENALPIAERARDAQDVMGIMGGIARLGAAEDPETANRLAARAVEIARSQRYLLVENLVTAGWVALVTNDRARAAALADEAVGIARAANDPVFLPQALELQALAAPDPTAEGASLEEAVELWRAIGNAVGQARAELAVARLTGPPGSLLAERAQARLRELGIRESAAGAAGLLMALGPERPPPLAIRTLGGFQLLRDGRPVSLSEWQSRKAREALKLLLARRGHPTPRDVLLEAFWPEEDPARSGPRLSVALSTIRAVLDPARAFESNHFLVSDDDVVRLDLSNVHVDVERFLVAIDQARELAGAEAVELLEAAEAVYAGDFLEEDAYEDWAAPLREEARAAYVSAAAALAESASTDGDDGASARYRLRILERDPYDEPAHLGLVASLARARSHGEARRAYRRYVARMEEIGVEPAPFPTATAP